MVKDKILKKLVEFNLNTNKFYNYFVFSFTGSLQFHYALIIFAVSLLLGILTLGLASNLVSFLVTFSLILWLVHGIHGVQHILDDYVYSKAAKLVLSTFMSLLLIKSIYLVFLV